MIPRLLPMGLFCVSGAVCTTKVAALRGSEAGDLPGLKSDRPEEINLSQGRLSVKTAARWN